MMGKGKISRANSLLVIIDIQEGLVPVIEGSSKIIQNANRLATGAGILNVPLIVTEQYPKGLKKTVADIPLPASQQIIEKTCFSCMLSDAFIRALDSFDVSTLILAGVESHICVLKTALDALEKGFDVHVVADAVGSRTNENKALALERMKQSGIFLTSTEMVLFQMLDDSKTEEFKKISSLIK